MKAIMKQKITHFSSDIPFNEKPGCDKILRPDILWGLGESLPPLKNKTVPTSNESVKCIDSTKAQRSSPDHYLLIKITGTQRAIFF